LCDKYFKKYLEHNVFGSYVYCDNIKIYKTPKTSNESKSSWIWHLDNNPKEQVKIMLYLSDVTEGTGAFEYIKDSDNKAIKASTRRVDYKNWCTSKGEHKTHYCSWYGSRVPNEAISTMIKSGCNPTPIYGKIGTAILFDNNIVHKGSLPTKGDRLAATLQFRPINYNRDSLVDKSYTGDGWVHTTFNMDPSIDTNIVRR
jgi:ectoine hydroxylase-related dioxygenase (phytanoyl-CoA dioxygenase family)